MAFGGPAGVLEKSKQSDMSSACESRLLSDESPNAVSQNLRRLMCECNFEM